MNLLEVIKKRRSIRRFKPDPVPEIALKQILEAARLAPSGVNIQPWRFMVVKNPQLRARLAEEAAFRQQSVAEAPVVIVCCADLRSYLQAVVRAQELLAVEAVSGEFVEVYLKHRGPVSADLVTHMPAATINTVIAIEHMVLMATSLGLGTCWVQFIRPERVAEICELDEEIIVVALLPVGYPAQDPSPRPRLALQEILLPEPGTGKKEESNISMGVGVGSC